MAERMTCRFCGASIILAKRHGVHASETTWRPSAEETDICTVRIRGSREGDLSIHDKITHLPVPPPLSDREALEAWLDD